MIRDIKLMAYNGDYLALGGVTILLPIIVPVWVLGRVVAFFVED
jgi:hypothetical protein